MNDDSNRRLKLSELAQRSGRVYDEVRKTEDSASQIMYSLTRPTLTIASPNNFQKQKLEQRLAALRGEMQIIEELFRLTGKAPQTHSVDKAA